MNVGLRLDLRQTQQLVMTPQLQQAIKLLQMSNIELGAFVENEIEKNPLLTLESDGPETLAPGTTDPAAADSIDQAGDGQTPEAQPTGDVEAADLRTEDHTLTSEMFDTGTENLHDSSPSDGPSPLVDGMASTTSRALSASIDDLQGTDQRLAEEIGLRDHLRSQLGQMRAGPTEMLVARYLVEELDEHGYLRTELAEIAQRLSIGLNDVEAGLELVQRCDPTGVGARDMGECLALQLRENGVMTPQLATLLDNMDLLARNDRRKLMALCKVDDAGLRELTHCLRTADPRPCASFDAVEPETLVPDILLRQTSWGGWQVELNPDTLPRVLMDRTYITELGRAECSKTKLYLTDCRSNASWLIKSLDQRAKTIVKIAAEIVRQQDAFFSQGVAGLKPLTLRDVAEAVGMHESTASRVTSNKYMATERGIFELKFFFTNAVGGGDGDISAEAVRHRIKTLVADEAPDAILSDDTLVDMLAGEGIDIARRTVAKYRQSLNIPSSVDRRRQNAARLAS